MADFYKIHVRDHSHLGGPMGTEYTTGIESEYARDVRTARIVFRRLAEKHRVREIPDVPKVSDHYDFGHVGMSIANCYFSEK